MSQKANAVMNPEKYSKSCSLRVIIAHQDVQTLSFLKSTFTDLGHEIIGTPDTAAGIVATAVRERPDLICTGVDMPDFDGVTALVEISGHAAIPSIIVTPKRSIEIVERALKDHVMAYLVEPVQAAEIKPTVYLVLKRFEQFENLRSEVEDLKEALEKRKFIERAKGVLMRRADLDEDDAYRRLQRMASDQRIKMIDAAKQILAVNDAIEC